MKGINPSKNFLEKVVDFDFERNYTQPIKILAHFTIWGGYLLLFFLANFIGYHYTFLESSMMALRGTFLNIIVFYIFFYAVVPYSFRKNYIILFTTSIILLIMVYLFMNILFYKLLIKYNFPIKTEYLVDLMERAENSSVWEAFSPRLLLGRSFEVIVGLSPIFFMKVLFDLSRTYAKSVRANRRIETLRIEKLKMENKFLNAQLNPHFLFNTLNNLYGLALRKDSLTPDLILKLSEIMRYTLYETNVNSISLTKEIQFIEDYVGLEKMRFNHDICLINDISPNDIRDLKIAPLIPFVFLENAFKYGLKSEAPFLEIELAIRNHHFYFKIENDYPPEDWKNNRIGGIGIKNVKKRLELIYPKKYKLTINKDKNRYIVNLMIDLSIDEN